MLGAPQPGPQLPRCLQLTLCMLTVQVNIWFRACSPPHASPRPAPTCGAQDRAVGEWLPLPAQRCCQLPWKALGPLVSLANTPTVCTSVESMPRHLCCHACLAGSESTSAEVNLVDRLLALHAGAGEAGRLRRPAGGGLVRRSVSGSTAAELSRGVASARAPVSARGTSTADARWGPQGSCAVGYALTSKAAELASARASLQTVVPMQVCKEDSHQGVVCVLSSHRQTGKPPALISVCRGQPTRQSGRLSASVGGKRATGSSLLASGSAGALRNISRSSSEDRLGTSRAPSGGSRLHQHALPGLQTGHALGTHRRQWQNMVAPARPYSPPARLAPSCAPAHRAGVASTQHTALQACRWTVRLWAPLRSASASSWCLSSMICLCPAPFRTAAAAA